jgi:hypothetical protein
MQAKFLCTVCIRRISRRAQARFLNKTPQLPADHAVGGKAVVRTEAAASPRTWRFSFLSSKIPCQLPQWIHDPAN